MTSPISEALPRLWSAATDGTAGAASSTSTGNSSARSGDVNMGGIDTNGFLQLLVAQLTHQDPMNPTDSSTYITQEAQFSMVQSMNTLAKQNAAMLQSQQMQEATSFIGKSVTYIDENGAVNNGVVSSASPGSDVAVVRIGATQVPVTSITAVMNVTPTAAPTTDPNA